MSSCPSVRVLISRYDRRNVRIENEIQQNIGVMLVVVHITRFKSIAEKLKGNDEKLKPKATIF